MSHYLFTSESVGCGHPDKIADQISDAILDACLREDPYARVACDALVAPNLVVLVGEITTKATIDYVSVVRSTVREIGYTEPFKGFDADSCEIIVKLNQQSSDIAHAINEVAGNDKQGAGDQGLMFGFACDDTKEFMPLPIMLAHQTVRELKRLRQAKILNYLGPDAKAQYTVEYDKYHHPLRIHTIVVSTMHDDHVHLLQIESDMKAIISEIVPKGLIDSATKFFINPSGRFVIGGPQADCGLTGRKIIVDTYGGMGRHGGGAFSGKDPTKIDRAGAYAARYVAKNIVASGLATRCEIQVSYAIGISYPIAIKIDTFGTGKVDEKILEKITFKLFDLSPGGIIKMLDLRQPIYQTTAFGGHFGREEKGFSWEKTDKASLFENEVMRDAK